MCKVEVSPAPRMPVVELGAGKRQSRPSTALKPNLRRCAAVKPRSRAAVRRRRRAWGRRTVAGPCEGPSAATDDRSHRAEHVVGLAASDWPRGAALHRLPDVLVMDEGEGGRQAFVSEIRLRQARSERGLSDIVPLGSGGQGGLTAALRKGRPCRPGSRGAFFRIAPCLRGFRLPEGLVEFFPPASGVGRGTCGSLSKVRYGSVRPQ